MMPVAVWYGLVTGASEGGVSVPTEYARTNRDRKFTNFFSIIISRSGPIFPGRLVFELI